MADEPSENLLVRWHNNSELGDALPVSVQERIGPVAVAQFGDRGRGLVVTRDCRPGELLFASRAFAVGPQEKLEEAVELACSAAYPADLGRFLALAGGSEATLEANHLHFWQRSSTKSRGGTAHGEDKSACTRKPTHAELEEILRRNRFALTRTDERCGTIPAGQSGIWLLPSMMNHDCAPNTAGVFLGDFLFIRSSRCISEGEEITYCYCKPALGRVARRSALQPYGFSCCCLRCEFESFADAPAPRPLKSASDLRCLFSAVASAEGRAIAAAPLALREAAAVYGLDLRGTLLAAHFDALMSFVGAMGQKDPIAVDATEALVESLLAVHPCSQAHVFVCGCALAAHGVRSFCHGVATLAAAERWRRVHLLCYGGGVALWRLRMAGSLAQAFVPVHMPGIAPLGASPGDPLPWYLRITATHAELSVLVLSASSVSDIDLDLAPTEAHFACGTHSMEITPPAKVDIGGAVARFHRRQRRLEVVLPWA